MKEHVAPSSSVPVLTVPVLAPTSLQIFLCEGRNNLNLREGETRSQKLFAKPQNQKGESFVARRFDSGSAVTRDKDGEHTMMARVHDQMGISCSLWEELESSLSALVVLTMQPRHS